jgi:DNA-binding XRE family transcriptional regulator
MDGPDLAKQNRLQEARVRAALTQVELVLLTEKLASEDPTLYKRVGLSTVEKLESHRTRPRPASARTLSKALSSTIEELFPGGLQIGANNPQGITRIPQGRARGGRPSNN